MAERLSAEARKSALKVLPGWSEVPGATLYHLYVSAPTARLPAINNAALSSSSFRD